MQRRKLLVIDDDPAIFRYLRRGLMREGYDVVAASGQGMLARLDEWQPDIVLLDFAPPHVRSQIQAIKARSAAPLIGLLSSEDTQTMIAALDAGVDDCVPKPFSLEELDAHSARSCAVTCGAVARHPSSNHQPYGSTWYSDASIAAIARSHCRGASSNC